MGKDRRVEEIKGIFTSEGKYEWDLKWSMDEDKLKEIVTNEELLDKIKDDFNQHKDTTRFKAQIVKRTKEEDAKANFVISLGHFIYSHHYSYFPDNEYYHETIINQELFEDIVQPFQKDRSWKIGDGVFKSKR